MFQAQDHKPQSFAALLRTEPPSIRSYIEPAILPLGGLMVLGGGSKIGKSLYLMEVARALVAADRPFGCPHLWVPETAKVLLIDAELGEWGLRERGLKVFSKDLAMIEDNLYYASKVSDLALDTDRGLRILRKLIDEVQPNVLILDPLGKLHNSDENSNSEMGRIYNNLDALRVRYAALDLAIIVSHHTRKPPDDKMSNFDPLSPNSFSGASRTFRDPDCLVTIQRFPTKRNGKIKYWETRMRLTLRHGEDPEDMMLTVNEQDDLRVRWKHDFGPPPSLILPKENKEPTPVGEQAPLMFA